MIDPQLVIAEGDQQQAACGGDPPPDQCEEIEGCLIGPLGVLDQHQRRGGPQLVEQDGKDLVRSLAEGDDVCQVAAGAGRDVHERPERAGGEQLLAAAGPDP